MKGIFITVCIIILFSLENCLLAQQSSFSEQESIQIPDSCKEIVPADTIFYPCLDIPAGTLVEWEEFPTFPGGDKGLADFIMSKTIYPESAIADSVSGKVVIRFLIESGRCLSNILILRSVRSDLDNEAIRVVKLLPKFKPGKILKKSSKGYYWGSQKTWYMVPFNFSLHRIPTNSGIIILPHVNK